jgi:ATP-dependent RNA helicase DeaD
MGKKDRIHPRDIVDLISESTNLTGAKVGDIALYDKFSFVEVPSEFADEIVSKLGRTSIQGSPVSFSIATPVQEGEAKQEGFNRGGGPGGFGGDRERRPFNGGERREGGYGGGYKGGNRGGSSFGGGERREGGYGGGYTGNRDGGSGYGNRPSYGGGERREGGYGKSGYGNKGGYGDRPSYGNKPSYGTPREYETPRTPRAPRNESFDE